MNSFNNQGKGFRPGEVKGQPDGVGEAFHIPNDERIGSQHRGDHTAECARSWGHHGLIVLEADLEEDPAVGQTRLAVLQHPAGIYKLLKFQLEDPRARHLLQHR